MAEENAEAAAEPAPASTAPSGGGPNKMVLVLTVVNLLFTLGIGVVLFVSFQKEKTATSVGDIHNEPIAVDSGEKKEGAQGGEGAQGEGARKSSNDPIIVKLDQFTINLSTPGSALPKFVRVNIAFEMSTQDSKTEVESRMPQVRNTVIDLFNSKRPADLATQQARELLKEEIQNHVNTFIKLGKVKGVYFTNFALSS